MKDSIDQLKLLIPTFESESFLSGFEMALLNSIKQLLPSIETKGVFSTLIKTVTEKFPN